MNIFIYDIEVFSHDWIVVFHELATKATYVIHNNNYELKEFIRLKRPFLGGFNNKHYDDWIIQSMLLGADNETVKAHNDFIISGKGRGWEFPFVQFKKREFKSFDLRDDLPENLSLKAIEGNMGHNIVETGVAFDIGRPLAKQELASTIEYCKADVMATYELFKARKNYIEAKKTIAEIKGIDEIEAISLTNAKLTAKFLDAKKREYDDEFIYQIPGVINLGKYQYVYDFFKDPITYTIAALEKELASGPRKTRIKTINRKLDELRTGKMTRYDCTLETIIAGVKHVFAWGGLHGAIPKFYQRADDNTIIVMIDVGSYYPSMMLVFHYMSRSIPSPKAYEQLYNDRLEAKYSGNKRVAGALKLPLNTKYGALKNKYNDLHDPRMANAVCITGQLMLTDLLDKLEVIPSFKLIQSNTDGIGISVDKADESQMETIVADWEHRTGMGMEYTSIHSIAQKDVNNYVMKAGETYTVKDHVKTVTEKDEGHLKLKGGYVSLAYGGDFRNNSLVVCHKALVNYLMDGVPIADTINAATDILEFQTIAKTGHSYAKTVHEVNGIEVEVQRANRVYASKNTNLGTLHKVKDNGRKDKIAGLPEHCLIDNEGVLSIEQIDRDFYIELTEKRLLDYTKKREVTKMPTKKTEPKTDKTMQKALNLYQKINAVREEFLEAKVQKTGVNRFAEYKYYELADIVPVLIPMMNKHGLTPIITFTDEYASLKVVDNDSTVRTESGSLVADYEELRSPMRKLAVKGMNEIQALGGVETYQRRYLYMAFLDIVEQDAFDSTNGKDESKPETKAPVAKKATGKKSNKPATPSERKEATEKVIDPDGSMTSVQETSLKNGLKKLRSKDAEKYEKFIRSVMKKAKAGMTKAEAEKVLLKIGEKVAK